MNLWYNACFFTIVVRYMDFLTRCNFPFGVAWNEPVYVFLHMCVVCMYVHLHMHVFVPYL